MAERSAKTLLKQMKRLWWEKPGILSDLREQLEHENHVNSEEQKGMKL